MAKFFVCLVLLLGLSLSHGLTVPGDDDGVKSVLDTTLENGHKVHQESFTDKECHVQLMTSRDETTNVENQIINDLDDDAGLVLFSDKPDVCFVRHLPHLKVACRDGYEKRQPEDVKTDEDTSYAIAKDELSIVVLPANLQEVCAGKKVFELVEVDDNDDDKRDDAARGALPDGVNGGGDGAIRKKRSLSPCIKCKTKRKCGLFCKQCTSVFWGLIKNCKTTWCCRSYVSCEWKC